MRDITLLHPQLQVKVSQLTDLCKQAGLNVLITETLRTAAEQDALYAQGRTTPGSIVTNAKGSSYQSMHQWGVAFDFCRNVKGEEYSNADGFFEKVGKIGKVVGLFWGGDFKSLVDRPHFQMPEFSPDGTTACLRNQFGKPENFIKTWEDEDMLTDEQFAEYMKRYETKKAAMPPHEWAEAFWKRACTYDIADGQKLFDDTNPQGDASREQLATLFVRLGFLD